MSLTSEYWKAKKKKEEETTVKSSKSSSGSKSSIKSSSKPSDSLTSGYWEAKKQLQEQDIAPVSSRVVNRLTISDIAPYTKSSSSKKKDDEDKWYKGWFQKGALDDGYDFGDITRTILGTTADVGQDLLQGAVGIAEKSIDFLAANAGNIAKGQYYQNGGGYNVEQDKMFEESIKASQPLFESFVKKDIINEEKISRAIISGDYEKQSVLDAKADQTVQSGGQLLATAGLQAVGVPWWVTTGATAWGAEAENALNQGATMEEANLSGAISAGAEVLTEKLSGGIKFGGKALDDAATDYLSRAISNKFARNALKFGLDATGEGFEEILSQDISSFGQWLTYRDEEELKELLGSEEAMDEKIQAFIGGALMGGVSNVGNAINSNRQGVDSVSGRTKSEEAVVRKVYDDLVAEAKKDGKVTAREKSKIYDRVTRELEKGGISTDTIESLLDEEGYKAYQAEKDNFFQSDIKKSYDDALKSEAEQLKELQKKLDELTDAPNTVGNNRLYDSIVSQMTELQENPSSANLKAQLDQEVKRINDVHNELRTKVHDMVKGTKLEESYNELIRSNQKYEVDVTKYTDPNAKKTIENILKSGMGDNTNHFHEYADWLAQISADKGMSFSLTNNEALKGTEHDFSAEGLITNGYKTADGIVLNMDSPKALNSTVGHEVTHVLEQNTELYQTLQDTVFKYEIAKNGQEAFDKRLKAIEERYKGKDADAKAELTADLVGDYLFTDYDFAHNLSVENRNLFEKIYDEIKYFCKVVTAGSKEARELEKVKKAFDDAYRANVKGKADAKTQHSLVEAFTDSNGNSYDNAVLLDTDFFDGISPRNWGEKLQEKVNERAENDPFILPIVDESGNTTLLEFAKTTDRVTKDGASNHKVLDKLSSSSDNISKLAVIHIDEIVSVSEENSPYYTNENNHQWLDKNGWLHRNANVINQKNGNIYNLTVDIAKAADGRTILYATNGKIKKVGNVQVNSLKIKGSGQNSNFDTKVAQNGKGVKRSLSDSTGKELTKEQADYFKDSKVRDENGNLKVMYHGSPESFTVFDKNKAKSSGYYGKGFYFTDSDSHAKQYGNTYETYLNITNPLQDGTNDITKDQLRKFVEAIAENEDYGIDNYGYGATVDSVTDSVYGKSDFAMLMDINASCVGNMVEAIELFNEVNGTDYNGIIAPTETVAFYPEQIKRVDNQNPTSNPDIHRSISKTGEKSKQRGDWNVYGSDFGYKGDFAPVIPTPNSESVLPGERHSVEEMFPDEPDIDQAEYDNLLEVKDALETRLQELSASADFNDPEVVNEFEKLTAEWSEASTRLLELDAELSDTDRVDSITDADAPPEMDAPYYESEPTTLTKKATADIVRDVRASLGLTNPEMADCKDIIERYRTGEIQTRDELIEALQDKFGTFKDTEVDERLAEVKRAIRTTRINVSDTIKHGIADYAHVMRSNRGKILFAKNGLAVDEVYKELQEQFPDFFNEDADMNPEDQLRHIIDIANTPHVTETEHTKDIGTIAEAADLIINGIGDFKHNEKLNLSNRESKQAFESLVRQGDKYAPMDDIAPVKPIAPVTKKTTPSKPTTKPVAKPQSGKVAEVLTKPSKKPKEGGIGGKLVSALVDKGAVFEKVSLDSKNMEVQSKWQYALPTQTEARAQYFMENGTDKVKSLKSILKEQNKSGKTNLFDQYMYHIHNIDRMTLEERLGLPNLPVYGDTVTAEVSRKKAARLEKQNPEFKRWAQAYYDISNYLLDESVKGNLISQETADYWREKYPHHVPIKRVDKNGLNVSVPLDTNKTGVNTPFKRATGGNSDIEPLANSMAQRIEQTYRAIARNSFGIELKNTLGTTIAEEQNITSPDELFDSYETHEEGLLKAGTAKSSPTFTVFENGKRVEFEITEDMYDALKPTNKILASRNPVIKWLGDNRRNLLTVWNPVFALYRNPIKDIQDVAINSQHAVRTYANVPNAIYQMVADGKYANEYHKNGGKSNTYFDGRKNEFKAEDNLFKKAIGMPLRAIENAGEFIEEIPRLAEYIASRKEGRSIERSMLDAARVTTNFAAGGDFTKFLNSHGFTFLNASVQGASQHVRNFREATKLDGLKGFTKTLAKYVVAGVPGIILNSLLWDDDEEYEELNEYVKQNYFVVAKTDDGKFIRIPKGRTIAVVQNLMEQMQHLVTGDDEADFSTFFELFMNNIAPNNPLENNILAPVVQTVSNNAWYGGDIVPSRLQDLPAEEQFDESTDSISKWLGEKTGLSPIKLNYLLDQYSGGAGDVFLPMLTPEAESGDNTFVGNMLAPWKKEMTTDMVLNNKNPGDFYDLKDELEKMSNSRNATEEDKMKTMYMDAVGWEMGDLYAQKREIQSGSLPDDRKYEAVRQIQEQINELAKNAVGSYDNVSIDGLYSEVGDKRFNQDVESGKWYEIKPKNSDGSDNWYYQMEQDVTKALGISYGEYWNNREEYNYAYEKPEQYTVAKAVGGYQSYRSYTSDLWDLKADKDKNGKSINGSRKKKVIDYVNNLDADYGTKIIMFKTEYPADDTYNYDIIEYLNGREDISYEEMETILKYLDFKVDSKGNITW